MALIIELQQVTEADDGSYMVTVNVVRDTGGVVLSGKTFNCTNAAELKEKIQPKFEQLIVNEQRKEQIRLVAQGVIDEILTEVPQ